MVLLNYFELEQPQLTTKNIGITHTQTGDTVNNIDITGRLVEAFQIWLTFCQVHMVQVVELHILAYAKQDSTS